MYEEAFELGEKSFEDQFKKPTRKVKKESSDFSKVPTMMKSDESRSNNRSSKLEPIDDKKGKKKLADKQNTLKQETSNVS